MIKTNEQLQQGESTDEETRATDPDELPETYDDDWSSGSRVQAIADPDVGTSAETDTEANDSGTDLDLELDSELPAAEPDEAPAVITNPESSQELNFAPPIDTETKESNKEVLMPRGRAPRRGVVAATGTPVARRRQTSRRPTRTAPKERGASGRTRPVYSSEQQETIMRTANARVAAGAKPMDVAQEVGVSYPTLLRWLKRDGYQATRGRRPASGVRRTAASPTTRTAPRAAAAPRRAPQSDGRVATGNVRFDLRSFVNDNQEAIIDAMLANKPQQIRNAVRDLLQV